MSHVLRSAVAAVSLFTCPACATTGSFEEKPTGAIGPEATTVRPAFTSTLAQTSAPLSAGTAPRSQLASFGQPPGQMPADGTAALLAWEQSRTVGPTQTGFRALMFEPSDSRLRIVLNMHDFSPGQASRVALATSEESAATGGPEGTAALWAATPIHDPPENGDLLREPLGTPAESPGPPVVVTPVAEPRATPEPGTLILTVVGLGIVGWRYRRSVRRMESSA